MYKQELDPSNDASVEAVETGNEATGARTRDDGRTHREWILGVCHHVMVAVKLPGVKPWLRRRWQTGRIWWGKGTAQRAEEVQVAKWETPMVFFCFGVSKCFHALVLAVICNGSNIPFISVLELIERSKFSYLIN